MKRFMQIHIYTNFMALPNEEFKQIETYTKLLALSNGEIHANPLLH